MQPYIYTEARRTYDTGVAFLQVLFITTGPEANGEAYDNKDEYIFGDEMVVAPVVTPGDKDLGPGKRRKSGYPRVNGSNGLRAASHRPDLSLIAAFSVDQTPVYRKAGAIVPMQPEMSYTGEKPVDPLIVNVWPPLDLGSQHQLHAL